MTNEFAQRVEALVAQIPSGRIMTYGQLAALSGSSRSGRIVGGIAHYGGAYLHTTSDCPYAQHTVPPKFLAQNIVESSSARSSSFEDASLRSSDSPRFASKCAGCAGPELPWHRVVNKKGGLATGYPGGRVAHQKHLESEGVEFQRRGGEILLDVDKLIWRPDLGDREMVNGK